MQPPQFGGGMTFPPHPPQEQGAGGQQFQQAGHQGYNYQPNVSQQSNQFAPQNAAPSLANGGPVMNGFDGQGFHGGIVGQPPQSHYPAAGPMPTKPLPGGQSAHQQFPERQGPPPGSQPPPSSQFAPPTQQMSEIHLSNGDSKSMHHGAPTAAGSTSGRNSTSSGFEAPGSGAALQRPAASQYTQPQQQFYPQQQQHHQINSAPPNSQTVGAGGGLPAGPPTASGQMGGGSYPPSGQQPHAGGLGGAPSSTSGASASTSGPVPPIHSQLQHAPQIRPFGPPGGGPPGPPRQAHPGSGGGQMGMGQQQQFNPLASQGQQPPSRFPGQMNGIPPASTTPGMMPPNFQAHGGPGPGPRGMPGGMPVGGPPQAMGQNAMRPGMPGAPRPAYPGGPIPPMGATGPPRPPGPSSQQPGGMMPQQGGMPPMGAASGMMGGPGMHPMGPPGPGQFQQLQGMGGMPPQPMGGQHPGMMGGQQPQGMPQAQRRLDPSAMPSAVQVMEDDRVSRSGLFQTGYPKAEQPPLVTTPFYCEDQGNCNPRFMRSTLYSIPQSQDLLKQTSIPIALAVTPLAKLHAKEQEIPVIDLGELGPVRCHRCKAYMCPFMEFFDGGRRFKCPFCRASSDVPEQYFAHLDQNGRRTDLLERPELFVGSYEMVATKEYCKDGVFPKEPAFVFMLDVSYNAVQSGLVSLFCQNIKHKLAKLPSEFGQDSVIKVGFATYDQTIHFYNLKSAVGQPQMLVVGDVQDVFVPLAEGFLVGLAEAEAAIDSLLKEIPEMFSNNRVTEIVLGPVIQAGVDALKSSGRSGKIFVLHSSLPIFEAPGKLINRDDRKMLGTDKEKSLLLPAKAAADFYDKLTEDCLAAGCAVDAFLFPNSYTDAATIGRFCASTGGQVYKYAHFQAGADGGRFLQDLDRDISKPVAFDAIMRIRSSTGIRPTGFYGNFHMQNTTDVELGAIDEDKCVTTEIKHDDKLDANEGAYFQAALLFTSVSGMRRLRIHNLALNVAVDLPTMYRCADLDAVINFLAKDCERMVITKNAQEMRGYLISRAAQILATYRAKCSQPSSPGQLILPEGMKLLPLYANCILKHDAISGGQELNTDDKAWLMQCIPSLTIQNSLAFFYPRFLAVAGPGSEVLPGGDFPPMMRCSHENLLPDKACILENGIVMFFWIGNSVDPQFVKDVFGVASVAQIDAERHELPVLDNPTSIRIRDIVAKMQAERQFVMKIFFIRQNDKLEPWFKHFLVEDPGAGASRGASLSYVDFLCHIHKEIKELLN